MCRTCDVAEKSSTIVRDSTGVIHMKALSGLRSNSGSRFSSKPHSHSINCTVVYHDVDASAKETGLGQP